MSKLNPELPPLYHGTPYSIHDSEQPFLDPRKAVAGNDLGDPAERCVYVTSDMLWASMFAFKTPHARSIRAVGSMSPLMVYDAAPPCPTDIGNVYNVRADGTRQLIRPDGTTGMWVIPEAAMPMVYDPVSGLEVAGIPVESPQRQFTFGQFVVEQQVSVYRLSDEIPRETYLQEARAAGAAGCKDQFFMDVIEQGWLQDITQEAALLTE